MIETQVGSRTHAGWTVVGVEGELDLFSAPQLREAISECLRRGANQVLVDLSDVRFVDSTALGVLIGGLKRVRDRGGDMALLGPQRTVRRVLGITGLDKIFAIYDSPAQVA